LLRDFCGQFSARITPRKLRGVGTGFVPILSRTSLNQKDGHCEERSDVAIQMLLLIKAFLINWIAALCSQ